MTEAPQPPRSYSERRELIARVLEPVIAVSSMIPGNSESAFEPGYVENSLMCSWADPTTGDNQVSVFIRQVADGVQRAERIRQMIAEETPPGDAWEITGQRAGEFAFVLDYLGTATAVVSDCVVEIIANAATASPHDLVHVALDVGRGVGCSSYVDDYAPPAAGTGGESPQWTTDDGLIFDPRTIPPTP